MNNVRKWSAGPKPIYRLTNTVKDLHRRVSKGQVKSIAIVVVQADGTFWTATAAADGGDVDAVHILGTLRFLEEDLIRLVHGEPSPLEQP